MGKINRKSGAVNMQTLAHEFLCRKTVDPEALKLLVSLGYPEKECNNGNALVAKLFSMSMGGDLKAMERLFTLGGLTGEEIRKNADKERKDRESEAKVELMKAKMPHDQDGDDNGCVHIYLPEIEKLEEDDEDEELE